VTSEKAKELLHLTRGCVEFNTAFIERLNGTFRERLASLTRKFFRACGNARGGNAPHWMHVQFFAFHIMNSPKKRILDAQQRQ
jgi:hypothetical protein